MGDRGRPKAELVLSTEERLTLERLANRRKSAQAMAMRARIVLTCAKGGTNREVAQQLVVSEAMVGKWRRRFVESRLDGLSDDPRPGAPRTITDDQVEAVIVKTLEEKPDDATHWSTRSMAGEMGMSQTTIRRIWNAFGLQPHRAESFKLSTDPLFVEKVRDVVGLYLDPPERAMVLCVDEKSQIQALNRFQPILPMMPGTPERRSHDYVRHGTTSLFAALDMASGKVIGSLRQHHRATEFKKFLIQIDKEVPIDLDVHLIVNGHWFLPTGGHLNSPGMAIGLPRYGHGIPHPALGSLGQGLHSLPAGGVLKTDRFPRGLDHMGVVKQAIDEGGGQTGRHELVEA